MAGGLGQGGLMKIEHIGLCVPAPVSMGNWYRDHLGFKMLRQADPKRAESLLEQVRQEVTDRWGLYEELAKV